jgi:hypothetical protein
MLQVPKDRSFLVYQEILLPDLYYNLTQVTTTLNHLHWETTNSYHTSLFPFQHPAKSPIQCVVSITPALLTTTYPLPKIHQENDEEDTG